MVIKMTRMYVIRHCEAMGNQKRLFQGSTDCDISEIGAKQLEFLKERFASIHLDRVYSSPLIRAQKTAHAIADEKGIPVEVRENLKEIDGGIVEGKPFLETFNAIPGLADTWDNHPQDFAPEGGEPMRHAYERIWTEVQELIAQSGGKTIAVTSHGGIIRNLICRLMYGTIERLKDVPWSENTAVTLIEFDDAMNFKICFSNDHYHVPEEYMPKRTRLSSFMQRATK